MKHIRYALVFALLTTGGLLAKTDKPAKGAKYKKVEAKKHDTYTKKSTTKSAAKDRYGKTSGTYKKMEMKKHEKGLKKPVTKPAATKAVAQDRPATPVATTTKTNEPTFTEKAAQWLGLGGAGVAASKAVATQKDAVHHTGPRAEKWTHNFGPGAKGFEVGENEHGHWTFAGYRPDWWQKNYPIYWKDVVGPLYRKSAEYQKTLGK